MLSRMRGPSLFDCYCHDERTCLTTEEKSKRKSDIYAEYSLLKAVNLSIHSKGLQCYIFHSRPVYWRISSEKSNLLSTAESEETRMDENPLKAGSSKKDGNRRNKHTNWDCNDKQDMSKDHTEQNADNSGSEKRKKKNPVPNENTIVDKPQDKNIERQPSCPESSVQKEYVTRSEFNELSSQIGKITDKLDQFLNTKMQGRQEKDDQTAHQLSDTDEGETEDIEEGEIPNKLSYFKEIARTNDR